MTRTTTLTATLMALLIAVASLAAPAHAQEIVEGPYDYAAAYTDAENGMSAAREGLSRGPLTGGHEDLRAVAEVWAERAANGAPDPVDVTEVPDAANAYGGLFHRDFNRADGQQGFRDAVYDATASTGVPYAEDGLDSHGVGAVVVTPSPVHPDFQDRVYVAYVVRETEAGATPGPDPEPEPEPQRRPPFRVLEADPAAAAVGLAKMTWPSLHSAAHAVLSRDDVFADSLAGSPLAGDGPVLFTGTDQLDAVTAEFLTDWFPAGATVYLLGGEAALSPAVEQAVADLGLVPVRLAGSGRVETALAIARHAVELYGPPDRVLVARADDWADSIAVASRAAATGQPVVLTPTDRVPDAVVDFVVSSGGLPTVLGGTAAVSQQAADQLGAHDRVAGATRDETALAVAESLWGLETGGVAELFVIDGDMADGWAWGLAAAARQASRDAALVMIRGEHVPASTAGTAAYCLPVTIVGDYTVIAEVMDSMFTQEC
ncbi:cell wall-binding repeat-containing protein [Euzebya pacifica]|nr:cell wall-binding repeat-containing protein [Euzebya pacifica]